MGRVYRPIRSLSAAAHPLAAVAALALFLIVQIAAVAHAATPEALAPDHGACVLCAAGDRANDAVAPAEFAVEVAFPAPERAHLETPKRVVRRPGADPPARAPPVR